MSSPIDDATQTWTRLSSWPVPAAVRARVAGVARAAGLVIALAACATLMLWSVDAHYPVKKWLFWKYISYWLLDLGWATSCLVAGHAALVRLCKTTLAIREHLVFAFGLGVLLFFAGMFVGGLFGLYGYAFAIAWPVVLAALGARSSLRTASRAIRHVRAARRTSAVRYGWLFFVASAFGLVCLCAAYLPILSPNNAAYDARWYHLRLAEHYVAAGGIVRFSEGWYQAALPHLASLLYAWAFMLPRTGLFDRVEICAHLEFVIFLATCASIPCLVRRLVPGTRPAIAWVAVFLFPGILLYDSCLSIAADHIAAFWAVPIYIALLRVYRDFRPSNGLLLAAMLAGAILTKYQSMYLLPLPIAAFLLRASVLLRNWIRQPVLRRRWLATVGTTAFGGLALTAPHWLKNAIWYGDPFYPFLNRLLPGRPWTLDSAWMYTHVFRGQFWEPTGTSFEKLRQTLRSVVTFAFVPNDWPAFHGAVPVFGFLFTLLLLTLPFLRRTGRIWGLAAATHLGVLAWYVTHHQDRYLQILLPWMVSTTVAIMVLVWRTGSLARLSLSALVALQIVWAGDVYFIPAHMFVGSQIQTVATLLSSGHREEYDKRFEVFSPYRDIGRQLPRNATVLVHEIHDFLGMGRRGIEDTVGWQGGLSYGRLRTPTEMFDTLAALGVTHVLFRPTESVNFDLLAGDLKFYWFVNRICRDKTPQAHLMLASVGERPAETERFPEHVCYLGCGASYNSGRYRLDDLVVPGYGSHEKSEFPAPLSALAPGDAPVDCGFVVREKSCSQYAPPPSYDLIATRGDLELSLERPH